MLGRSLISFTSITFCFLRASFFFFCSSYLYLPKSRILQTGGSAVGAISTRSKPASAAAASASLRETIPIMVPRSSISLTRATPISSLIRGPSRVGIRLIGGLGIYILLFAVDHVSLGSAVPILCRGDRRLLRQSSNRLAERKGFLRIRAQPAHHDRTVGGLAAADNQHHRDFRKAVLAHLIRDFFAPQIGLGAQPGGGAHTGNLGDHLQQPAIVHRGAAGGTTGGDDLDAAAVD